MKSLMRNIHQFLQDKRAEFAPIFLFYIFCLCLSFILVVIPPFVTRQKVVYLVKEVVEEVEYNGKVDASTYQTINSLLAKYSLQDKNPQYFFKGNLRSDGSIQLRDEFSFTLSVQDRLKVGNVDGLLSFPLEIKKTNFGKSQVYYKE